MSRFQFRAIGSDGQPIHGAIDAPSAELVLRQLRAEGALPIEVAPQRGVTLAGFGRARSLGPEGEAALFGGLAVLLKAGLVLDQALDLATSTAEGARARRLASALRDQVRSGRSLSEAMRASLVTFDPVTLALVRAGEEAGKLEAAIARLAELARQRQEAAEKLRSALTYPIIVLIAAGLTVVFLLMVVVPAFTPMFQDSGAPLPASLQRLLWLRGLLTDHAWLLLTALAAMLLLQRQLARMPGVVLRWHMFLLSLPWLGPLLAANDLARFARALGGLLEGGSALTSALPLAQGTLRNRVLVDLVGSASEQIRAGRSLSDALAPARQLPTFVSPLLRVGEAAGQPAAMLLRIATLAEHDVRRKTERVLALLPAVLIVGMGGMVAGIVSMLLGAVLDVNQLAF